MVLAFLARYRPHTVAVPMERHNLNVTHRSKKKDAVLKRLIALYSQASLSVLKRS